MNPNTLIIGLDGVDFKLFEILVERNVIPVLGKLSKNGARGRLLSTVPLSTPITWTSFITGKNAGKHGIYGFVAYENNSYKLKVLNSLDRKTQTLWHILNRDGKSVGIFNLPSLFPPERIDGYIVCGMLAPSLSTNFTYPRSLKDKLLKDVRNYEIDIGITMSAKDSKEMLLKKAYEITEKRIAAAKLLMEEFPCDLTMLIFTETDRIQHFFLKDMDTDSKYKDVVVNYFRFLDEKIGELIKKIDENTTIIVMSDHGMAPLRKVFYVNGLLKQLGFMGEEKKSLDYMKHSFTHKFVNGIADFMVRLKLSPDFLKRFLPQRLFARLTILAGYEGGIDWTNTKAYFSSGIGEGIVINLKGRQPKGIVTKEEYEDIRNTIVNAINALKDPDTGASISERVYKREELFSGDFVKDAPDIVIKLKEGYGTNDSTAATDILKSIDPSEQNCSDHTRNGILIIHGKEIKKGFLLKSASILDIAPTILRLMQFSIPSDFDGRVLEEALVGKGGVQARLPGAAKKVLEDKDSQSVLTEEEEKQVKETLRKLGYLKDE